MIVYPKQFLIQINFECSRLAGLYVLQKSCRFIEGSPVGIRVTVVTWNMSSSGLECRVLVYADFVAWVPSIVYSASM